MDYNTVHSWWNYLTTVMKYVVVEAVKLILMILCSFNIITRRNWTNSGTDGVIFTTKNRLTEYERFVLCFFERNWWFLFLFRSWQREIQTEISLKTFGFFASFFPVLNSPLSWQCDANIEYLSDLAKRYRHTLHTSCMICRNLKFPAITLNADLLTGNLLNFPLICQFT